MQPVARVSLMLVVGIVVARGAVDAQPRADGPAVNAVRAKEIAAMLGDSPVGFGPTIDDREAWRSIGESQRLGDVIARAEKLAAEPIPDLPDELYLDYSRTGNRENYQSVFSRRNARLAPLVLAECIEDQGRFIEPIEQLVAAICAQRSWVLPAHDPKLEVFNDTRMSIDLASSLLANELAQARWQLGDRLSPRTRGLIEANVRRRAIELMMQTFRGERDPPSWLTAEHNWNAVCLANVTGAALATLESRDDRAAFVAAAEQYSLAYLRGFTQDGYCSEGLTYWNYGFSHYVRLAELLLLATGGQLDLYDRDLVRAIAMFPARFEIAGGVFPAFADCPIDAKPAPSLVRLLNRRLHLGVDPRDAKADRVGIGSLCVTMMYAFAELTPGRAPSTTTTQPIAPIDSIRSYFDQAQVLIARPRPGANGAAHLAVALKGGHNAEQHNHNDVGSFVVVVAGNSPLLLDPGLEVYTARTFGKQRYQSKVINSWGHPVPRVAGALQRTGRDARAEILRSEFTDEIDTFALDLRRCYDVPELRELRRTFVYDRRGDGSLVVTDAAEFASPQAFGTALITYAQWKQLSPRTLVVFDDAHAVRVDLDAEGAELIIKAERIDEDVRAPTKPTRIGIELKHSSPRATITATIAPTARPR